MIQLKMKVVEIIVRENGAMTATLEAVYDENIAAETQTHDKDTFVPFRVTLPLQNPKLAMSILPGQLFTLQADLAV